MAGEFGDLANIDFSGAADAAAQGFAGDSGLSSFTLPATDFNLGANLAPTGGALPDIGMAPMGGAGAGIPTGGLPPVGTQVPGGPGGGGGFWDSLVGSVEKDPLGAIAKGVGLGTSGVGIYSTIQGMKQGAEQRKVMLQEQRRQQGIAAPAAAAGSELTSAGTQAMLGGALPPELEQMVDKYRDETRARLRSYFAKAGITDSTMMEEQEGWVEEQTGLYREQLAQQLLQSGYQGIGTAMGPSGSVGSQSERQMGGTADFLKSAQQSINLLTGSQGG